MHKALPHNGPPLPSGAWTDPPFRPLLFRTQLLFRVNTHAHRHTWTTHALADTHLFTDMCKNLAQPTQSHKLKQTPTRLPQRADAEFLHIWANVLTSPHKHPSLVNLSVPELHTSMNLCAALMPKHEQELTCTHVHTPLRRTHTYTHEHITAQR